MSSTFQGLGSRGAGSGADAAGSWGERQVIRFIPRRHPVAGDYLLTMRNIYVLPSRPGILFAIVLLAMLVCSINYGLALGYALSFLIFGIAVVGLMHTFRNLSSLTARPGRCESVFAGQPTQVSVLLVNSSRLARYAVRIDAPGMTQAQSADIAPLSEQMVHLALPTAMRGWMNLPRLTLSTRFPVGIWRAWSYWLSAQRVLIYPAPETPPVPLPGTRLANGDGMGGGGAEEDLAAVRPFVAGDSPRRIAWTAMARTGSDDLLTKQFDGGASGELLLDFASLPGTLNTEARLSRLTRWVVDADARGIDYALQLPDRYLDADNGPAHRQQCLEALALFGTAGNPVGA